MAERPPAPPVRWLRGRAKSLVLRRRLAPAQRLRRWFLKDVRAAAATMVGPGRLDYLYGVCSDPRLPAGALVECGVGPGGCLAVMAYAAGPSRTVWGFDSFEGMPALTPEDEGDGQKWVGYQAAGPRGLAQARDTLARYDVDARLVAGWFEQTLPGHAGQIGPIAVLRLDNDWYRSTLYCLEQLYAQVVRGGVVIIDDYGQFAGCRKAVDEFRAARGIAAPLVQGIETQAYWIKASPV